MFTRSDIQLLIIIVFMLLVVLFGCAWLVWKFGPHIDEEALKKNAP